ncbi:hypothetical protein ACJX0J_021158 [Zea mays]
MQLQSLFSFGFGTGSTDCTAAAAADDDGGNDLAVALSSNEELEYCFDEEAASERAHAVLEGAATAEMEAKAHDDCISSITIFEAINNCIHVDVQAVPLINHLITEGMHKETKTTQPYIGTYDDMTILTESIEVEATVATSAAPRVNAKPNIEYVDTGRVILILGVIMYGVLYSKSPYSMVTKLILKLYLHSQIHTAN